jgi:hypothetical protein
MLPYQVQALIQRALDSGGPDNITAALLEWQ